MKYTINELFLLLKCRLTENEILAIAGVRKDLLQENIKKSVIENDQMALRIYFRLFSELSNVELLLLDHLQKNDRTLLMDKLGRLSEKEIADDVDEILAMKSTIYYSDEFTNTTL